MDNLSMFIIFIICSVEIASVSSLYNIFLDEVLYNDLKNCDNYSFEHI